MAKIFIRQIVLVGFVLCLSIAALGQEDPADPRTGHTETVNAAVFSPDGKFLATAGDDQTIIVWSLAEAKKVMKIVRDKTAIKSIAYSPDGKIIAGGGSDGVKFWDTKTGKEIGELMIEYEIVDSIAFSPDGKLLAAGSPQSVSVWNVATRQKVRVLEKAKSPVVFHPKGNLLATASGDDLIKIWNVKTGVKLRTIEGAGEIGILAFNPPGNVLASVSREEILERKVKLWRTLNGTAIKTANEIKTSGLFAFAPDGKSIVVASQTPGDILILNSLTGKEKDSFSGDFGFTTKGVFSPDGKLFAVLTDLSKEVSIIDFQTNEEYARLAGHSISIAALVFSADNKTLFAGYNDGSLIYWNFLTGKIEKIISFKKDEENILFPGFGGNVMEISNGGDIFVVGSTSSAEIFDASTGDLLSIEKLPNGNGVFSPDGRMFAVFNENNVDLFTTPDIKLAHRFPMQVSDNTYAYGVNPAFSSDGKMLAVGSKIGITIFDIEAGKQIKTMSLGFQSGPRLKFLPDDNFLIAADGVAKSTKVFDLSKGEVVRNFEGQGTSFAVSEDGKILAASDWQRIVLSELSTGKTILTIKTEEYNSISRMSFNRDGSVLAVGDAKGITLYRTATGQKIRSMQ